MAPIARRPSDRQKAKRGLADLGVPKSPVNEAVDRIGDPSIPSGPGHLQGVRERKAQPVARIEGTSTRRAAQNGLTYAIRINNNLSKEEVVDEELREGVRKPGDVPSNAKPKGIDQKQQRKADVIAMNDPETAEDPSEVTSVIRSKGLPKALPDMGPRRAPPLHSLLGVANETPEEGLPRKLRNESVRIGCPSSKDPGTTAGSFNRGLPI